MKPEEMHILAGCGLYPDAIVIFEVCVMQRLNFSPPIPSLSPLKYVLSDASLSHVRISVDETHNT